MKRGMIAMSIVATLSLQAEESKITNIWKASPQYQEFVKMGAETSAPAKKLRDETVLDITKKELEGFKNEIDPKYQANMANKVDALPNGLKVLLAEINLKLKPFVSQERDAKDISTINILLYQYVESILYGKGIAERKMRDIAIRYPELEGTEATRFLLEIGKLYDESAKIEENIAKANKKIAENEKEIARFKEEIAKAKSEAAAWERINELLKEIPDAKPVEVVKKIK